MTLEQLKETINNLANDGISQNVTLDPVAQAHAQAALAALHTAAANLDLASMAQARALAEMHNGSY